MENVKFRYKVYDNVLEIFPEGGVQDNSIYKLHIKNIASQDRKRTASDIDVEITTKLTPSYCSVDAIKVLVDSYDIPESTLLYMIRQASRQAEFINGGPPDCSHGVPYVIEKYVEVKASLDALTRAYATTGTDAGLEGTLGRISFKNGEMLGSIKNLIKDLRDEEKIWQDAIRGYVFGGRNVSQHARWGDKALYPTPVSIILDNYTRNGNMGRKHYIDNFPPRPYNKVRPPGTGKAREDICKC